MDARQRDEIRKLVNKEVQDVLRAEIALIAVAIHMASLESFGVPYLSPFAPLKLTDLKDSIVRFPIWRSAHRPEALHPQDIERLPHKDATSPRGGGHGQGQ